MSPVRGPTRSDPREQTDADVVRLVLEGRRDAFAVLVRRHQDELYRHARGMRIDHDTASDLVQDAFVTAYRRLAQCSDPERFRFWLLRILRNRCMDWLRDIRRRSVAIDDVVLESDGRTPEGDLRIDELRRAVTRALDGLTEDLREAFLMKHHEGRSYQEMAEIADASVSAMKMRVLRAREALRDSLDHVGLSAGM